MQPNFDGSLIATCTGPDTWTTDGQCTQPGELMGASLWLLVLQCCTFTSFSASMLLVAVLDHRLQELCSGRAPTLVSTCTHVDS